MDLRLEYLLEQYVRNSCSIAERAELMHIVRDGRHDREIRDWMERSTERLVGTFRMNDADSRRIMEVILGDEVAGPAERMDTGVADAGLARPERTFFIPRRWVAAAAILVVLAGGMLFYLRGGHEAPGIAAVSTSIDKGDLPPGHYGATLHLSNGKTILLDSAGAGVVGLDKDVEVVKEQGGLRYAGKTQDVVYNELTTARGRQWQVTLPDGTKVWLNASSSIRYPLAFMGNQRLVEMSGEAYFEVSKDEAKPFVVKIGETRVQVLGTRFDVMAYSDESQQKTTLIDGAVRVSRAGADVILKPGQQAVTESASHRPLQIVSDADIESVLAWKNGWFEFNRLEIGPLMREVSRWYDVDVDYSAAPPGRHFSGIVSRNSNASAVLQLLRQAGLHFRVDNRKITILP